MMWLVGYEEMVKHLADRQKYHEEQAEKYTQKMLEAEKDLAAKLDEATTVTDRMMTKTSNSYMGVTGERDSARNSARAHAQKAVTFKWKREHVKADAYELCTTEAEELEFIANVRF
jgi:hypothetical protein